MKLLSRIEPIGLYSITLAVVWGVRTGWGPTHGQDWWLIPFVWVFAACLPGLWRNPSWLSRKALIGDFKEVVKQVVWLSVLFFPVFAVGTILMTGTSGLDREDEWWRMASYQLLYVGLSEVLFFRGYLQRRLDDWLGRPYQLFGARVGVGLIGANVLFSIAHVIVRGDPRSIDVFFPGLLFGWLQSRTNATLAPVLFHGLSNVVLFTLRGFE